MKAIIKAKELTHTCQRCGVEFRGDKSRKVCGLHCRTKIRCEWCQKVVDSVSEQNRYMKKRFCSRECSYAKQKAGKVARIAEIEKKRLAKLELDRLAKEAREKREANKRRCCMCYREKHGKSKFCDFHRIETAKVKKRISSLEWKVSNPEKLYAQRMRRRAKKIGSKTEIYTREEIFLRDNWVCHICCKKTDKRKSFPHHDSPVIDHVIPLAKGGDDAPHNVACAHFICNSSKRDLAITLF